MHRSEEIFDYYSDYKNMPTLLGNFVAGSGLMSESHLEMRNCWEVPVW